MSTTINTTAEELTIKCICGSTEIEHSHDSLWKCDGCGRFHDGDALDRMADAARYRRDHE